VWYWFLLLFVCVLDMQGSEQHHVQERAASCSGEQ
jgi:hypothetical protein